MTRQCDRGGDEVRMLFVSPVIQFILEILRQAADVERNLEETWMWIHEMGENWWDVLKERNLKMWICDLSSRDGFLSPVCRAECEVGAPSAPTPEFREENQPGDKGSNQANCWDAAALDKLGSLENIWQYSTQEAWQLKLLICGAK